jgi:ER lumen protein retaining receptor
MKVFFIGSSLYILYLMKFPFRPTLDPNLDTFKVEFLLIGSFVTSMVFNYEYSFSEVPCLNIIDLCRFSGRSVFGLKVWLFYLNCLLFKGLARQKISRRIICLLWVHIELCISQIGSIDTLQMIIGIPLLSLRVSFRYHTRVNLLIVDCIVCRFRIYLCQQGSQGREIRVAGMRG